MYFSPVRFAISVITHDYPVPADDVLIRVLDLKIVDLADIWFGSRFNTLDSDSTLESSLTKAAFQILCRDPFTSTRTRAIFGKEAAKVLLSHASNSTTEIYLLEEVQEAIKVAKALSL